MFVVAPLQLLKQVQRETIVSTISVSVKLGKESQTEGNMRRWTSWYARIRCWFNRRENQGNNH